MQNIDRVRNDSVGLRGSADSNDSVGSGESFFG